MATTNTVEAPGAGLLDLLRVISRPSLLALGVGVLAVRDPEGDQQLLGPRPRGRRSRPGELRR